MGGHVKVMNWLFHHANADVDSVNNEGVSAAHLAARRGHISALRWLDFNGMNLVVEDNHGFTPLDHTPREFPQVQSFLRDIKFKLDKSPRSSEQTSPRGGWSNQQRQKLAQYSK